MELLDGEEFRVNDAKLKNRDGVDGAVVGRVELAPTLADDVTEFRGD